MRLFRVHHVFQFKHLPLAILRFAMVQNIQKSGRKYRAILFLRTARFICTLRCLHLFSCSLTPKLVGKRVINAKTSAFSGRIVRFFYHQLCSLATIIPACSSFMRMSSIVQMSFPACTSKAAFAQASTLTLAQFCP